jgi:tetratricopeptide (TPR) repeat protein
MYRKALSLFDTAKDPLGQGNVYHSMGLVHFYKGEVSKALKMYDIALPFFEKVDSVIGQGNVYQAMADIYLYAGDYSNALKMYDKALPFFEKDGDPLNVGNMLLRKGDIYLRTGDHPNALKMHNKALPLFEDAGDYIGQGHVYHKKGIIYYNTNDYSNALEMYKKALFFFEKVDDPSAQGNVYTRIGDIYLVTGDNTRAFEMYNKALPFFEKAENPLGQGNVYQLKGDIFLRTGYYSRALEFYDKALPFFERWGEPLGQGSVYKSKGNIYFRTGNFSKAVEMYDKALPFFKKAEDPFGQGYVYLQKGSIFLKKGDKTGAFEMYDKALSFFIKAEHSLGQGYVYESKGHIYLYSGDNTRAIEMYDKALPFLEKAGTIIGQGNVYRSKGDFYSRTGDYQKALEMYNKALVLYTKVGEVESISYALHGKAKVLAKQGKNVEALSSFKKSISNLEKVRAQTTFSEMKETFLEKVYNQYEDATAFMFENDYHDWGFKHAESMKARVFYDQLAEGLVKLNKGISNDLKQKRDNLVSKLSALSKEINKVAGEQNEKKLKVLKDQYSKVEGDFEELLIKIRLNNPLYASVRYPEPVTVQNLQENILKKKELLLRYFISEDKIHVFLISKENFSVVTLKDNAEDVNRIVEKYLISVEENNHRRMKEYGKALYKKLFKPLETSIKERINIIIIPDGELATIPFESFVMDDKRSHKPVYLLEKYRIKYIQSASVLSILREHYQSERITRRFIGFGDPVYDYESFKQGKPEKGAFTRFREKNDEISQIHRGKYKREGGVLKRLQGSGQEVHTIAELFKKHTQKCVVHLREQANESNAKLPGIKEFDYIHFSCHGVLGEGFQGLVLSQIPGSPEDGYLTLNEIMNCDTQ